MIRVAKSSASDANARSRSSTVNAPSRARRTKAEATSTSERRLAAAVSALSRRRTNTAPGLSDLPLHQRARVEVTGQNNCRVLEDLCRTARVPGSGFRPKRYHRLAAGKGELPLTGELEKRRCHARVRGSRRSSAIGRSSSTRTWCVPPGRGGTAAHPSLQFGGPETLRSRSDCAHVETPVKWCRCSRVAVWRRRRSVSPEQFVVQSLEQGRQEAPPASTKRHQG